jgi:hypothetical protein
MHTYRSQQQVTPQQGQGGREIEEEEEEGIKEEGNGEVELMEEEEKPEKGDGCEEEVLEVWETRQDRET